MTGIWSHHFEVVMRPLRDLDATPTRVLIQTRTAAQAGRDAVSQHPDMKVLSVTRASAGVADLPSESPTVWVPRARASGR